MIFSATRLSRALLVLAITNPAGAQALRESFEGYPAGSRINGQGGWVWQYFDQDESRVSDAVAFDGLNSLHMAFDSPTLHPISSVGPEGRFRLSVMQYIAPNFSGKSYLILSDGTGAQPVEEAMTMAIDSNLDSIRALVDEDDWFDTLPLVYGRWVAIEILIDFDADWAEVTYDGRLLTAGVWSEPYYNGWDDDRPFVTSLFLWPGLSTGDLYYDAFLLEEDPLGSPYCKSTNNSTGSPARIRAQGSARVEAGLFELEASPVPNQSGLFFYSAATNQIPFGNGFRCVGGGGTSVYRLPLAQAAGASLTHAVDFDAPPAAQTLVAGSTWNFQAWFRDPMGGGAGFNLSDALAVTFSD